MRRSSSLTPAYTWDVRTQRYHNASGRFVPQSAVRASLDRTLDNAGKGIRSSTQALREGRVSLADWQAGMRANLKASHLAATALAKGGWHNMAPSDYGRVGRILRDQYGYLSNFAAEITSGKQKLDGRVLVRADLYAQSGRPTYEAERQRAAEIDGKTLVRSIRHASDSCPGCIEQEAAGVQRIADWTPIGARECRTRCRCSAEFYTEEEAAALAA